MADADLYELNRTIGELTAEVRGLRSDAQEDRKIAADHRQGVREELSSLSKRQTRVENDLVTLTDKVTAHDKVTVEVTTLRTKAEGAGTLGRWLIRVGIGVVTAAGWLIGVYTWITGRPPP